MTSDKRKLQQLDRVLSEHKTLLVVTHDYPDPDALASALLLTHLARKRHGMRTKIAYGGLIMRAENRAMVKQLRMKLTEAARIRWSRYRCIALVDTQPKFGNHSLPAEVTPSIVLDHHPRAGATSVLFEDVRLDASSTTAILLKYLEAADLELTTDLATAVAYAIRTETQDLAREASLEDIRTYLSVYAKASKRKLARILNPKLPRTYFVLLQTALQNARIFRNLSYVHLGDVESPEFVALVADLLLRQERISWVVVTGRFQQQLHISMRCSHVRSHAGRMLKQIIGKRGSAGGHVTMAGGQIRLHPEQNGSWEEIEAYVIRRFLKKFKYDEAAEWRPMLAANHTSENAKLVKGSPV